MTHGIFVTGTDTGVGKTLVACALLRQWVAAGRRAVGMKPIACGIEADEVCNADVSALIAAGNVAVKPVEINPYAFAPAIAPHLAAAACGVEIDLQPIAAVYGRLAVRADAVVVEGAGGALVPLNAHDDMLDIARCLDLPVLLVVGMRLGCLNHALLTAQSISARGLRLAGWIANRIDPHMAASDANIESLRFRLPAPLLAIFPWQDGPVPIFSMDPGNLAALWATPER